MSIDTFKLGVSTINLRGMSEEYTLVLVDGKRVSPSKGIDSNGYNSTAGAMPPITMIERVEVIKGPASLRYGSEAMGGVINIITKKMPDKATASIRLETRFQEHRPTWGNTIGFNGNIFAPINEQFSINLRARVSQSEQNHIRWKDDKGNLKFYPPDYTCTKSPQNNQCANPYAFHAPGAYQVVNVGGRLNFIADEQNSFYFDTDFTFQRINSLNTSPSQFTEARDYEKLNLVLNHDGEYSFGNFNTYLQYNTISRISHGKTLNYGAISGTRQHNTLLYNPTFAAASTFTKNFDFGNAGALILNAGPSYFYERLYNRGEGKPTDQRGYQVAAFGEGEYLPLDWFGVTAGVRVNYAQTFGVYAAPRAYLNFYPTSWLTLKTGFASGFQVPDLDYRYDGLYNETEASGTNTYYYGNKNLDVEKSYNYEASAMISSSLVDFMLTGYITQYKDAIDSRNFYYGESIDGYVCANNRPKKEGEGGIDPVCSINVNVSKALLWGGEAQLNFKSLLSSLFTQWGGGIYVDLGYAYTDTEQKTGSQKGKPLNDIPLHSLSSKLSYKTSNLNTYIRYKGTFKKTTSKITPGEIEKTGIYYIIPKYFKDIHIVDLGTNYHFANGITLGLVVNNLLDKDFTKDYFMWRDNFPRTSYGTMLPGRNYWLTIGADF